MTKRRLFKQYQGERKGTTLYYNPEKPKPYELRKEGFKVGRKYTEKGAQSLITNMQTEIRMGFLKISPGAKQALEEKVKTLN